MRFALVLALSFLLAAPMAFAAEGEARGTLAVSIIDIEPGASIVTWTPAPGALAYNVYRGSSPDELALLAVVSGTMMIDEAPPLGEVWYVIVSVATQGTLGDRLDTYRGSCVNHRGTTGLSLTAAHCMPTRPL